MQIWYDRQGQPLDTAGAERLLRDKQYKRVALTEITSASDPDTTWRVSTVWLGVDHSFGEGDPIIFETMVFADDSMSDQYTDRYATEDQARAGHAEIVTMVAATIPDERVTDLDDWPRQRLRPHPTPGWGPTHAPGRSPARHGPHWLHEQLSGALPRPQPQRPHVLQPRRTRHQTPRPRHLLLAPRLTTTRRGGMDHGTRDRSRA